MVENQIIGDLVDKIDNDEVNAECPYGDGKSWNNIYIILHTKKLLLLKDYVYIQILI